MKSKSLIACLLLALCLVAKAQETKAEAFSANFDSMLLEVNQRRFDRALQNLFPIQKEIRIRLSGPLQNDPDLARRLQGMISTPAVLSTIALLRSHFANGDWNEAHDDATLIGFGLTNLWARVPAYEKLAGYQKDHSASSGAEKYALLKRIGYAAVDAREWDTAKKTGAQMLELLAQKLVEQDPGAYRHTALTILGLVALNTGSLGNAEKYLLDSAKVQGGESMRRHGPNFRLAAELLAKDRKQTVTQFFTLCEQLNWSEREVLKQWKEDVSAGRTPEFGAPNFIN